MLCLIESLTPLFSTSCALKASIRVHRELSTTRMKYQDKGVPRRLQRLGCPLYGTNACFHLRNIIATGSQRTSGKPCWTFCLIVAIKLLARRSGESFLPEEGEGCQWLKE